LTIAGARAGTGDITTQFFEGNVQLVSFNQEITRFRLVGNGAIIDVRNDTHIRLIDDPYRLPPEFPIIAPMTAVHVINGQLPKDCIKMYPLKHYLSLREKYESHAAKASPANPIGNLVSKREIDQIFRLNKILWEKYAQKIALPDGWQIRLSQHDTGSAMIALNLNAGQGFSIQPLYDGNDSPPRMVIINSYYSPGKLPPFTDTLKISLERDVAAELGPEYEVLASYSIMPPFETIGFIISRK